METVCPYCKAKAKVPSSFLGKRVKCKSEACQKSFVVAEVPNEPEPEPLPPSISQDVVVKGDAGSTNQTARSGNSRYPNLSRYLQWARIAAIVQLVGMLLFAFFLLATSIIVPVMANTPLQDAILNLLMGLLGSTAIAFVGYVFYVFTCAGLELVQVIVDIESNTRPPTSGA